MKRFRMTILAFVAISITVSALWFTNGSVTPRDTTLAEVLTEAKRGGYRLINTEQLWEYYKKNREDLLIVDTRQEWEYRTGHIKDAVNFPMEPTWLSQWRKKTQLETLLGPNKNRLIIFY